MTDVVMWFTGLASPGNLGYFLAGFFSAILIYCVRQKIKHRTVAIPWHLVGIAVGVAVIIGTSVQSSGAYNLAKQTAQEVQDCQREFNTALKARAKITSENDELSQDQRRIVFTWIHNLIFPPEPYASMDPSDPRRQTYGISLTIDTEQRFQASLNHQDDLQRERDKHQLPEPTCGK